MHVRYIAAFMLEVWSMESSIITKLAVSGIGILIKYGLICRQLSSLSLIGDFINEKVL